MKYIKMMNYRFSTDFTRVFIATANEAYAELAGDAIPRGCEEITEAEFLDVMGDIDDGESNEAELIEVTEDTGGGKESDK